MRRIYPRALAGTVTSLALAFTAPACGDDADSDDGMDAGMDSGGSCATTSTCDPTGDLACQNESDCPIVESGQARQTASTCGQGCLAEDDPVTCSNTCIENESGLSADCAGCYTALIGCIFQNCLAECGSAPDSCECADCQADNDCRSAFDACSGLEEQAE